ncbi:hypothetical protein evm_014884 [Chilo suppressalis]|nr:hypothetical protein evm_014884 [Chilo suppressalis]
MEIALSSEIRTEVDVNAIKNDWNKKKMENEKITSNTKSLTCYRCGGQHYANKSMFINKSGRIPGIADVAVELNGEKHDNIKIFVVANVSKLPLFGRQWLRHFSPEVISAIFSVHNVSKNNNLHSELDNLLKKYKVLFDESEVGNIKGDPVSLHVRKGSKPIFCRARLVPFALREKVETELKRLVQLGVLEKVDYSEYATPILPVLKANGEVRLCGDFKVTVNKQLVVDEHPLPTPEELFADLTGGDKFSKIDLKNAYLQMEVKEEDQKYLTLNTHKGLYRSTRLMYGLSCAPAKWQRKIENILKDVPGVVVFIDDIQLTAPSDNLHLQRLEQVFSRLANYGLKINRTKSQFLQNVIEYCGYKIDKFGIHKLSSKIDAIQSATTPKNISELQSFLGLVNYYGRFFKNLASTLEPLHKLLRKDSKWKWSKHCEDSFNTIKRQMQTDQFLVHFSPRLPLILATDASPIGVGAVISHVMPDESERPIEMASQTLNKTQRKWSQIDKEAYAIIFGVKKIIIFIIFKACNCLMF